MKLVKFLLVGIIFGITLSKAEVISWFRIYEMFKFQSIHMFGVILTAIAIGIGVMRLFKKGIIKDMNGNIIEVAPKSKGNYRAILGGICFGMGWAIVGACPGPMYILLGKGVVAILIVLLGAHLGALFYGMNKHRLPH
ncbi:MAG: YeeE/YedE family protein [Flavobacteriaceae bacterium]|nr:YeeE/YedE family protein [Flavobacteriaceae bacterium]